MSSGEGGRIKGDHCMPKMSFFNLGFFLFTLFILGKTQLGIAFFH